MNDKMFYIDDTVRRICELDRVIIYGAGTMGRALKLCLESKAYDKKVEFFIVGSKINNPDDIDGCPVVELDSITDFGMPIIVALNEKNLVSAKEVLDKRGFNNLILLNAAGDSWSYLKGNYFLSESGRHFLPYIPVHKTPDEDYDDGYLKGFEIFVVKSIYDKKLKDAIIDKYYETEVQAGAALADSSICHIRDDEGDNISAKNREYCELTVLYWLWKHGESDYIGLSHYRRRFDLTNDEVRWIVDNNIDVIVTIPVINTRGMGKQYCMDHSQDDWKIMNEEVRRLSPEYVESLEFVQNQIYFHPYNMTIMKRAVFQRYCAWLFPILFACEARIGRKADAYQNRYAGFLAERLLNVYLYHHMKELKICVAKKKYYQ